MANKVSTITIGNQHIPSTIEVEVGKVKVTLTLYNGFFEKPLVELVEALPKELSQEVRQVKIQNLFKNSRYVCLDLPPQFKGQPFKLQNKVWYMPVYDIAHDLYNAIKRANPLDLGREGNVNQLVLKNGEATSIGNYGYLTMGISQTRLSPSGGVSGGYSPHKLFEALIKGGYNAKIDSSSVQYLKCLTLLEARQEAKPQPKKPNKKK